MTKNKTLRWTDTIEIYGHMEECSSDYNIADINSAFLPLMLFLSMCPILFGSLYGLYSSLFDKGSSEVPVNLSDQSFYGSNMKGLNGQRIKHRFILIRHGESEHNANLENGVQDLQVDSPLTRVGHEQSKSVASYISKIGFIPDNICISPMTRTQQTAGPTLKLFKREIDSGKIRVEISPKYKEINAWKDYQAEINGSTFTFYKESFTNFARRIRMLAKHMSDWSRNLDKPTQTIIFTHSMVISELLNHIVNKDRADISDDEWSKVYWQVANGSLTCVDYTENVDGRDEWHIQAMNFTRHLPVLSGVKSPFV